MVGIDFEFEGLVCVCDMGLKIIVVGVDGLLFYVFEDNI